MNYVGLQGSTRSVIYFTFEILHFLVIVHLNFVKILISRPAGARRVLQSTGGREDPVPAGTPALRKHETIVLLQELFSTQEIEQLRRCSTFKVFQGNVSFLKM